MLVAQFKLVLWTPGNHGEMNALLNQGWYIADKVPSATDPHAWVLFMQKDEPETGGD